MRGGVFLRTVVVIALVGALAALIKALRGDPAPQFANHPSVSGGPRPVVPAPTSAPAPAPAAWTDPVDGACPDGYPVKAKLSSGIFHQPGGLSYERTNPDRCYRSASAAEADGLRAAKR